MPQDRSGRFSTDLFECHRSSRIEKRHQNVSLPNFLNLTHTTRKGLASGIIPDPVSLGCGAASVFQRLRLAEDAKCRRRFRVDAPMLAVQIEQR